MNNITLIGRLTSDPELRQTQSGVSVCSFNLAVERRYDREKTDFIPCQAWRNTAEFVSKYFSKGSKIALQGSLQTRGYEDKQGNKRTAYEVVIDHAEFVESKKDKSVNIENDEPRRQTSSTGYEDFEDIDYDEDDIPF